MNYNKVTLIGRLTKDPNIRYTPTTGDAVANFTLAINRPFKNTQGNYEADFIPIVVWRKTAENCGNYLYKGSLVLVEGRLQVRTYDKDGQRHWVTEVIANNVTFGPKKDQPQVNDEPPIDMGNEISEEDVPF